MEGRERNDTSTQVISLSQYVAWCHLAYASFHLKLTEYYVCMYVCMCACVDLQDAAAV